MTIPLDIVPSLACMFGCDGCLAFLYVCFVTMSIYFFKGDVQGRRNGLYKAKL
jgi:hypothetical protein